MATAIDSSMTQLSTATELPQQPRVLPGCELYGYEELERESAYWVDSQQIEGALPAELQGTLFLTCVGRNKIGGQQYGHWFDGDGVINAVTFRDGKVHFANRYVRTPKYLNETAQQRILYRGVGTQIPGGMLKNMFRVPGNAANTSVILHGGKLLALWEGGKPWELNSATLDSVGEYRFDGKLRTTQPFSAHPRLDPRTGALYGFGIFGVPKPKLHLYKIDPDGNMVANHSHYVGDYAMCHDFVITDKHAVFVLCPAFMRSPFKFLFGQRSVLESIEFDPAAKTKIVVLNLETGDLVRDFWVDTFFGFHLGNGHEQGDEIRLDVLCVEDMAVMEGLSDVFAPRDDSFDFLTSGARFNRFTLNLRDGSTRREEIPGALAGEFPCWNGDYTGVEQRYTWLGTIVENGTPYNFNAVQKVDHQTGELRVHDFGPGRFTSEVNFVGAGANAAEDDGYLISMVYNHHRKKSEIVLVDAKDMQKEVAVIPLQEHIPYGFHGNFYSETFV